MKPNDRRTLDVFARFLVAGGLNKAIDAWIVKLDVAGQLSVTAFVQFVGALSLDCLVGSHSNGS